MRSRLPLFGLLCLSACSFQAGTLATGGGDGGPRDASLAVDGGAGSDGPRADAPLSQPDAPIGEPDAPIGEADARPAADARPGPDGTPDQPDAPLAPDAQEAPDAPVPPDAQEPPDAAEPADAAAAPDAADRTGVVCGPLTCRAPTDVCCIDSDGGGMQFRCEDDVDCPSNGDAFECDGPEDCNGFACCEDPGGGSSCTFLGVICLGEEVCFDDGDCSGGNHCCQGDPYNTCKSQCN